VSALYAWLRRHPMLVDGVLAAALVFGGVGSTFAKGMFLGGPLAVRLAVPVVFRRKYPVAARPGARRRAAGVVHRPG
jgi:hypothetical protein